MTRDQLGDGAELLLRRYGGDLRRLHDDTAGVDELERRLQESPGIGPSVCEPPVTDPPSTTSTSR